MSIAVQPTFHCVAVKTAAEMGPHPEPRARAAVRRLSDARGRRRTRRNRRGAGAGWADVQERQRTLVLGDRRTQVDRVALVATVGLAAVVLGFVAARL